jgi:hypothetical protein
MAGLISLSVAEFAGKLKERYPQYRSVPDVGLVRAFVEKNPQFKIVYDGATPTSVTWERPTPIPVSRVDQQRTPASAVDNRTATQPTVPEQKQVNDPGTKEHRASVTSDVECRDSSHNAADELPRPPEQLAVQAAVSPAKEKISMSTRPILGVTPNDAPQPEPQKGTTVQASPTTPNQLPLATELPAWDLLPAENLLVRRRQITK